MKRISLLAILLTSSLFCFSQEYTKFMGISLNSTPSAFKQKLAEKGFKRQVENIYRGKIDNENCDINLNCENSKIECVSVMRNSLKNDTVSAKRIFVQIYKNLENKYGKPTSISKLEEVSPDFYFHNVIAYFHDYRISLYIVKLEEGDMTDLGKGDFWYTIIENYYPLPE